MALNYGGPRILSLFKIGISPFAKILNCTQTSNVIVESRRNVTTKFSDELIDLFNKQIHMEFAAGLTYLSMSSYFGRTDIALPGCQGYFLEMYQEEFLHATLLINYQLMRGGSIKFEGIPSPETQDWQNIQCALDESLKMEGCVKESLMNLLQTAAKHKDVHAEHFLTGEFINEQYEGLRHLAFLKGKAKIATNEIGVFLFDKYLYKTFVKHNKHIKGLLDMKKMSCGHTSGHHQ